MSDQSYFDVPLTAATGPEAGEPSAEAEAGADPVVPIQDHSLGVGFVKLEKNLASLGFFTPATKNTKKPVAKTIHFTRLVNGRRATSSVIIAPSVLGTLPTTADQDKYLAFQKLVLDRRRTGEPLANPVAFSTAELLRVLGERVDAGKNHRDVARWMQVMTATTIVSEDAVYFAGHRVWASDTFHVFDRAVSVGRALPDGTVADRNYVWLSEWQLHNLNHHFLLPIDLQAYLALRNHIAKALVPLLQIWLFASEGKGVFEKRYDELCQLLHVSRYRFPSKIREKFGPALDELVEHGYLTAWDLVPAAGDGQFKIIFAHGTKYFQDKGRRAEGTRQQGTRQPAPVTRLPNPETRQPGAETRQPGAETRPPNRPGKPPGRAADQARAGEGGIAGSRASAALPGPVGGQVDVGTGKAAPPGITGASGTTGAGARPEEQKTEGRAGVGQPPGNQAAGGDEDALEWQAEAVCRHFHQVLYGTGATAHLLPTELREAADIIQRHGQARALHLAEYFLREIAPRTRFRPDTICGLRPHVARAAADYDARAQGTALPAATAAAALSRRRQRHVEAFQGDYDAFRRRMLAQLEAQQPQEFQRFLDAESAERERVGAGSVVALTAISLRHFDRERTRLDRAWRFFALHPDWGILSFWDWDAAHNQRCFAPAAEKQQAYTDP